MDKRSVFQSSEQQRDGLTRRSGKRGRLEPSALIFLTTLRTVLAGTTGNTLRALRGNFPLRVKSPWRELRAALPGRGLRQDQS